MKYKIIHLFVKLTNLFQSKIVTTKVNKKIIFLFFIIAVIAMQLRTFTRFHWIIHDHVIHELYCHCKFISLTRMKSTLEGAKLSGLKLCLAYVPGDMVSRYDG
jgi:hypothetical protein